MAKTYHHLTVNDKVTIEHYSWMNPGGAETILELTVGVVKQVLKTRVKIEFSFLTLTGMVTTQQLFSRSGGQRWGAGDEDFRIAASHAQKKVKA